jgi:uncharacterized delta-60 repeat protein
VTRRRAALVVVVACLLSLATVAAAAVGDLDPSFGSGGTAVTQLGLGPPVTSAAFGIVGEADGRLLAGGVASDGLGYRALTLVRYLPDGTFDASFGPGGSGVVMTELGAGPMPSVDLFSHALALAPDGSIVVCGEATDTTGTGEMLVARYSAGGTLDASFASGGKFVIQVSPTGFNSAVSGCTVQPDGSVLGASFRFVVDAATAEAIVLRLDATGMLDPGFGSGGMFIHQFAVGSSMRSEADDVLALPDGRVVVAIDGVDPRNHFATGVARLTATGMLDPGFGSGGDTLVSIGGADATSTRVGMQSDGRLVVGGLANDASGHPAILAARFTPSGAPDPSFGTGGHRVVQPSAAPMPRSEALGMVVQPSGKIVLIGDADDTLGGTQLAVARLTADGALDSSFGGNGIVLMQLASGAGAQTFATGGTFTPEGRLVVSGYAVGGGVSTWFVAGFVADLPPVANFTVAPAGPVVGEPVTLDASGSSDPDGHVAAVAWDLNGDGIYGDATGTAVATSFATGGDHLIGVAVTDDDGVTTRTTRTVTVGCGTAATFPSADCRLGMLLASVETNVPAGSARDRLTAALTSARALVEQAATAGGRPARRALAQALHALGRFVAGLHSGRRSGGRALRHTLLASAGGVRGALKKLAHAAGGHG